GRRVWSELYRERRNATLFLVRVRFTLVAHVVRVRTTRRNAASGFDWPLYFHDQRAGQHIALRRRFVHAASQPWTAIDHYHLATPAREGNNAGQHCVSSERRPCSLHLDSYRASGIPESFERGLVERDATSREFCRIV